MINLWDDKTLELDEEAFRESEGKILLEQDMTNALRAKDYKKAVMLAFELKKPYQLLKVINEIIGQGDEMQTLDSVVSTFTDEQVCTLKARAGTLFFIISSYICDAGSSLYSCVWNTITITGTLF